MYDSLAVLSLPLLIEPSGIEIIKCAGTANSAEKLLIEPSGIEIEFQR